MCSLDPPGESSPRAVTGQITPCGRSCSRCGVTTSCCCSKASKAAVRATALAPISRCRARGGGPSLRRRKVNGTARRKRAECGQRWYGAGPEPTQHVFGPGRVPCRARCRAAPTAVPCRNGSGRSGCDWRTRCRHEGHCPPCSLGFHSRGRIRTRHVCAGHGDRVHPRWAAPPMNDRTGADRTTIRDAKVRSPPIPPGQTRGLTARSAVCAHKSGRKSPAALVSWACRETGQAGISPISSRRSEPWRRRSARRPCRGRDNGRSSRRSALPNHPPCRALRRSPADNSW